MFSVRKRRFTGALLCGVGEGECRPAGARAQQPRRLLPLLLAALLAPAGLRAQDRPPPPPSWVGDAAAVGVNALLGGLTAGVVQELRGGSFRDGFTRGAVGGVIVYGAKRVAVQDFGGAGLLGRQIGAVGTSVIRNASDGRPAFERVVLPAGPVRIYLSRRAGEPPARLKLDLATTVAAAYAVAEPELEFDAGESLSSGALVFRVEDLLIRGEGGFDRGAAGITRAGTIYVSDLPGLNLPEDIRHERVHVIQFDQFFLTMTDHVEDGVVRRLPGGRWVDRYVDLNLSSLVTTGLSEAFKSYYQRPWELEARYLVQR